MVHNLIIIGSGPAGYTAGIYAARAELEPLMFAGEVPGGQLMNTTVVENWPGSIRSLKSEKNEKSEGYSRQTTGRQPLTAINSEDGESFGVGVMGPELMMNMRKQAQEFGVEIVDKNVTKVDFTGEVKKVFVRDEVYEAKSVIVATGAEAIMLNVPGEREFLGRGVAVCAVCDAAFYKDKTAMVIGGGDAAIEDAMALTKFAKKVYLVHRRDEFRASKVMAKRAMNHPKIEILWNTELKEVGGKDKVEEVVLSTFQGSKLTLRDRSDFKSELEVRNHTIKTDGVFLAIGHKPMSKIFEGQLDLDERGYIKTKMSYPRVTQTNIEGVFAAGDVVDYKYQQAITAAAMGCQAALDTERYLEGNE